MKAIGTTPSRIGKIILYECLLLAGVSIIIGLVLGGLPSLYFEANPIDVSKMMGEMAESDIYRQMGIIDLVFPTWLTIKNLVGNALLILMINLISIIYPIKRINSLNPIDVIEDRI